jgi:uncharacterized protein (DUF1697 family)
MAELRTLLEEAGHADVRTHLQSGNVLLSSPLSPRRLEATLERELADGLGMDVRVLVRSRRELAAVVAHDPFASVATDHSRYLVAFLSKKPAAGVVRELAAAELAPEQLLVHGREIYAWLPDGSRRSTAAKLLDERTLGVVSTARNWNTVTKLAELLTD